VVKVRRNAAEALGYFPKDADKSVPHLKGCLGDNEKTVRNAAILSLGRVGQGMPEVSEALSKLSKDPDDETRLNVLVALAELGQTQEQDIPVLVDALSSQYQETAKGAVRALSQLGSSTPEKVLPGIIQILEERKMPASTHALRVLRSMKQAANPALPHIVTLYEAVDPKTKIDILEALTIIDDKGEFAVPILRKALQDPASESRKEALIRLMRFRSRPDVLLGPVRDVLKDPDTENRLLAIAIVRGFGKDGVSALPDLIGLTKDPDVRVRSAALTALVVFRPVSDDVIAVLAKNVKDGDSRIRTAAINAMRNVGPENAGKVVPILREALNTEKNSPTKRLMESVLESLEKDPVKANSKN
jgi:HEAT repeat protein